MSRREIIDLTKSPRPTKSPSPKRASVTKSPSPKRAPVTKTSSQSTEHSETAPTEIIDWNEKKIQPLEQMSQRCAWCNQALWAGEELANYNGPDPLYQGWMCHRVCNLISNLSCNLDDNSQINKPINKKQSQEIETNEEFQYAAPKED